MELADSGLTLETLERILKWALAKMSESNKNSTQNVNIQNFNLSDVKIAVPEPLGLGDEDHGGEASYNELVVLQTASVIAAGTADLVLLRQLMLRDVFNVDDLNSIAQEFDRVMAEVEKDGFPLMDPEVHEGFNQAFKPVLMKLLETKKSSATTLLEQAFNPKDTA